MTYKNVKELLDSKSCGPDYKRALELKLRNHKGQVHNAELAETAEPTEQDSSARLNSALFTGVLGKSP